MYVDGRGRGYSERGQAVKAASGYREGSTNSVIEMAGNVAENDLAHGLIRQPHDLAGVRVAVAIHRRGALRR